MDYQSVILEGDDVHCADISNTYSIMFLSLNDPLGAPSTMASNSRAGLS